jgi:hypothetical protein
MSLLGSLDEFSMQQIKAELAERERRKAAAVCTYCTRDYYSKPACKFPKRHDGREF